MPKDKPKEETTLKIECTQHHVSPYHPKDPDNLPKRIRCSHLIGGRPCKAACKVVGDMPAEPVAESEVTDPEPPTVGPATEPPNKDEEKKEETPKKSAKPKKERLQYDLNFYQDKMGKESKRTFDEVHSYITRDADLEPYFTKYFIIYKKDGKTTVQIRVARKYIKLYFNSKDDVTHDKVSDISATARGSNFRYMMSKVIYNDILLVKGYVDKSLE